MSGWMDCFEQGAPKRRVHFSYYFAKKSIDAIRLKFSAKHSWKKT